MKTNRLVFIVCLALILVSFTTAFALDSETVTTITCTPGTQLADDTLNEICDTTTLRLHSNGAGYGALVITLKDVDALSVMARFEEDGAYFQTPMLGTTPLYFSWEDLTAVIEEELQNNPDLEAFSSMMGMEPYQSMIDGSMTVEEYQAQAMDWMGMDDETMQFVSDIESSAVVETGAFSLEGSDMADQKAVTVLTTEEMVRAINLPIVRQQISNQLMMDSPDMTQEEIDATVSEELAAMEQALTESNITVTSTVYTADGEFVAMEIDGVGIMDTESAGGAFIITKTAVDQAEYYQLSFKIFEGEEVFMDQFASLYVSDTFVSGEIHFNTLDDGDPVLDASFNCDMSDANHTTGEIALNLYDFDELGQSAALLLFDQAKGDADVSTTINLYTASGTVDDIKADLTASSLISFNFYTVTQPESGFFSTLSTATPESSVQLLQMSDTELNGYLEAVQQSIMMTLYTIIDNLPADVSDSLLEGMGSF